MDFGIWSIIFGDYVYDEGDNKKKIHKLFFRGLSDNNKRQTTSVNVKRNINKKVFKLKNNEIIFFATKYLQN